MRKSRLVQIIIGVLLIAAMAIPMVACSSDTTSATTTSATTTKTTTATSSATTTSATTSATTTKTTTSATTTKTTTAATTTATTSAVKKFEGLDDIPTLSNMNPVNVALQGNVGGSIFTPLIQEFSDKTGVPCTYEEMVMTVLYPKVNLELISGSGAYDIACVETSTTCEWSQFLYPLAELAEKYDPQGVAGLEADLDGYHPTILRACSDGNGTLYELPYYTYQQFQFVRQDCLDDPTEQAAFKAKYGYDLAAATTWQQIYDQGEFFTRSKGEMLKGVALEKDIYGLALMAGQYEINDEIFSRLYGSDGAFMRVERDANGKLDEFVLTKKDKSIMIEVLKQYKEELAFASPGCLTGFWDFTTAQMVEGLAIILPTQYASLDQWAFQTEDNQPGGKIAFPVCPGNQGYLGAFVNAIARDSDNPEACYWLTRYLSCYETQKSLIESGYSGVRMDVFNDPKYKAPEWYKLISARGASLRICWDYQKDYVNDYACFNSDAYGKIYEEQIVLLHQGAIGEKTVEEAIVAMNEVTLELQRKFGSIPIREET
jgi:multiple sugar transport system substrate-binding protein